jgi:hypothetical protein
MSNGYYKCSTAPWQQMHMTSEPKRTLKEKVVHEIKEIFLIVIYLAASLSVLATIKSLVLVQQGINDFVHGYAIALFVALGAGKVVVIAQKLPVLKAWEHRPLIWSALYKSALMTLIVNFALKAESHLLEHHHPHHDGSPAHPILLIVTREIVLISVFFILFVVRGIDHRLGSGKLVNFMFNPPEQPK